jgi:prolyl oligopeptidase
MPADRRSMPSLVSSVSFAAIAVLLSASIPSSQTRQPPDTRREVVVERLHGVEVADPYRWLEDQNSAPTRGWIDAENAYTEAVIGPLPGKARIRARLTALMKIDTIGVPTVRGDRYFLTKRAANQVLPVLCVRKGGKGKDEVLIDPHPMSPDHTVSVGFQDVSTDGRLVAYGVRSGGEDEVVVRLMDVDTRKALADQLPKGRYSGVSITPDRTGIYYSRQTREGPRVFFHVIGTDPVNDEQIFGAGYGPEKIIGVDLSDAGRYLLIVVLHGAAARKIELYVQDLQAKSPIQTIVNDIEAEFSPVFGGDALFVRTDWKAPNYRVLKVDLNNPSRDAWKEIIPEGKAVISGLSAVAGSLLVTSIENVQATVVWYNADGSGPKPIVDHINGVVSGMSGNWDGSEGFFSLSSFNRPTTIFRYGFKNGSQMEEWAKLNVPMKGEDIEVKQVWYPSRDGTRIPMFLAHRKGLVLDGTNPTLLTGYGGFNSSSLPGFSARAVAWIENGGIYALANLRGGGEFGEAWHRAGMLDKKQNVFDDFIAAAEWLIVSKYTSPSKLAISGGSNGGLLVGAAMTQRPELFGAVVCSYPLLDMVRYHRFLVAGYWVPEYGSSEDPDQFKYLYAYSPYHHVKQGEKYPAVLFITGDADTRVAPLHARKMTALMQAAQGWNKPILLKYDTRAGHSGGLPIDKVIDDTTNEFRFLFWQLGVDPGRR